MLRKRSAAKAQSLRVLRWMRTLEVSRRHRRELAFCRGNNGQIERWSCATWTEAWLCAALRWEGKKKQKQKVHDESCSGISDAPTNSTKTEAGKY